MYAGYLSSFWCAFAALAAFLLPTYTKPWLGALAILAIFPTVIVGLSVEVVITTPSSYRNLIRNALLNKRITRKGAYGLGIVVGMSTIVVTTVIGSIAYLLLPKATPDSLRSPSIWVLGVVCLEVLIVALSPAVGTLWLYSLAHTKEEENL
jgi:hypothetical protein